MKLIKGKKYKIKDFKKRPGGWNGSGRIGNGGMDHFIGRVVTIRSASKGNITIKEDDRGDLGPGNKKIFWYFNPGDFEEIIESFKFDDKLFEI